MSSSRVSSIVEPDPGRRILALEAENARLREELAANLQRAQVASEQLQVAEINLGKRERELRTILDHMPAMIGYWDKNLHNRFCNYAYQTWFGLDPAKIPGKHIREIIGEERYRLNLPYIEGVLRGEAQLFERAIPAPDGSQVRYSLANYIPDVVEGEVQGFFVLVTETTALHEAHAALQASEERYRAVIEDQTELICRLTADGSLSFVNNVYCRFFGKTAAELIGQKWTPVCHPDDLPEVEAQLCLLTPEHPSVFVENRVYSATNQEYWMQFANRGFFGDDGRLLEIQSVGRDITERKKAELALREAHLQMERRVVERTEQMRRLGIEKALAEERERQAVARDLHDGLGQLLHVAKIRLDALLEAYPNAADAGHKLDALLAEASRQVRSLTAQLSPPVLAKLGLSPALRWLGEEMERSYGLNVEVNCSGPAPVLAPAQANILFRSARELLINTAKHSGCKQARLKLTQTAEFLRLSVEDDGVGLANVSDAWNQTQGFGLASIRERLTYLGGQSEIFSAAGTGFRVVLQMPMAPSASHLPEKI